MSESLGEALRRVRGAWQTLSRDGRLAALAATALFVAMLLPWYGVQGRDGGGSVTAFGAFSFVEAAVLLVALGVLALLFARTEQATFYLPGGDGAVVMAAGLWVGALLVWRLFDKPDADGALVGVQWGIFFALAAAGALAYVGSRMRRGRRPAVPARERPRGGWDAIETPPPPPGTSATQVLPPERRRRGRPPASEDQLTIPLPPSDEPG